MKNESIVSVNRSRRIVIALGGNAIQGNVTQRAIGQQVENVHITCQHIVRMIQEGYSVVIIHGNGPQVGNIMIQQEAGEPEVSALPMDVCGAMSQGQIGYILQQTLNNMLRNESINRDVLAITTQVMVDQDDPAFQDLSKPVGPYFDLAGKDRVERKGYVVKEIRAGSEKPFRRVVASPNPLRILESRMIKRLVDMGTVVIAAGGGGIPVMMDEDGHYHGMNAVLDKDLTGEKLAETVAADVLMILTDVEKAYTHFNTPQQKAIDVIKLQDAKLLQKEGHFASGSMGPKVEACIRFLEFGGERSIITSLDKGLSALNGETGTHFIL